MSSAALDPTATLSPCKQLRIGWEGLPPLSQCQYAMGLNDPGAGSWACNLRHRPKSNIWAFSAALELRGGGVDTQIRVERRPEPLTELVGFLQDLMTRLWQQHVCADLQP